jgi:hypothetical protein
MTTDYFLYQLPLLAQVAPSRKLAASFRNAGYKPEWSDIWPWLLLTAAAIAAYVAWQIQRKRSDMSQACDDPAKLFRELCQVHGLDSASRKLLRQLADACGMPQPALVFLTPSAFGGEQTPAAFIQRADELKALRERLF